MLDAPLGGGVAIACRLDPLGREERLLAAGATRATAGLCRLRLTRPRKNQVAEALVGAEFLLVVSAGFVGGTCPQRTLVELDAVAGGVAEDHGPEPPVAHRHGLAVPLLRGCGEPDLQGRAPRGGRGGDKQEGEMLHGSIIGTSR